MVWGRDRTGQRARSRTGRGRAMAPLLVLVLLSALCAALASVKVVVAGAGSNVGFLVFKNLLKRKSFHPVGLVQDQREAKALRSLGIQDDQIHICDPLVKESLSNVFDNCKKVVICSSSTPKQKLSYRVKNALRSLVGLSRPPRISEFYYEKGKRPYELDYLVPKRIIDAAVAAHVDQIVLLGAMGGYAGSKLNEIGRDSEDKDEEHPKRSGYVFKWRRAAERYLMKRCFFTILHAAPLSDEPPSPPREIVWNVDDALLQTPFKKISKKEVAEVIVQALIHKQAINRSIDVASGPEKGPNKDWLRFWSRPGNCIYPSDIDDP
jgi:hypothetical protein